MVIEQAEILFNSEIAKNIWKMEFLAPSISQEYKGPGQFVSIGIKNSEHFLRRPMSIASVKNNAISIIYKIFGSVTKILTDLNKTDKIEILGPLGNTFDLNNKNHTPILIGGGTGLAPILNIADYYKNINRKVIIIIGAKESTEHFIEHKPEENVLISTDDGSYGIQGTVIDALNRTVDDANNPFVYACGPDPMLTALKKELLEKRIPGQFSVESYMACGFGFCQGCAIPNDKYDNYHLVCKDGPVFNYNEVSFG